MRRLRWIVQQIYTNHAFRTMTSTKNAAPSSKYGEKLSTDWRRQNVYCRKALLTSGIDEIDWKWIAEETILRVKTLKDKCWTDVLEGLMLTHSIHVCSASLLSVSVNFVFALL